MVLVYVETIKREEMTRLLWKVSKSAIIYAEK